MSRRQDIQTAEGVALAYRGYGILQYISKAAPAGGEVGFAAGAEWIVAGKTGSPNTGLRYINVGSNGYGTNSKATWVETDPSAGNATLFGSGTAGMLASGNLYRTILLTANGIKASATAALKIVDIYTLPANSFDVAGRGLQFSTWCNNTGTSGDAVRIQVVANPTNAGLPAQGAGIAGQTDGTVTVTGGTVILDTGASYSPTGTVTFSIQMTGQLFKTGAATSNTQEALVTQIFPSAGLTHTAAWANQALTENVANVFAVCISAATSTNDIVYQGMEITAYN